MSCHELHREVDRRENLSEFRLQVTQQPRHAKPPSSTLEEMWLVAVAALYRHNATPKAVVGSIANHVSNSPLRSLLFNVKK
jgi:hypothetical protein